MASLGGYSKKTNYLSSSVFKVLCFCSVFFGVFLFVFFINLLCFYEYSVFSAACFLFTRFYPIFNCLFTILVQIYIARIHG